MNKNKQTALKSSVLIFKNVRAMCAAALLCAAAVTVAYLCKFLTIGTSIRITFENLPIILSGYLFGPVAGFITGVAADFLNTAISAYGIGGMNPIITLGAGCVGLTAGLVSNFAVSKSSPLCLTLTTFTAHVVGNMLVKSLGIWLYYHTPMPVILIRVPLYTVIAAIELLILTVLLRSKGIKKAIGALKI